MPVGFFPAIRHITYMYNVLTAMLNPKQSLFNCGLYISDRPVLTTEKSCLGLSMHVDRSGIARGRV